MVAKAERSRTNRQTHKQNERITSAIHFVHLAEIKISEVKLYKHCANAFNDVT